MEKVIYINLSSSGLLELVYVSKESKVFFAFHVIVNYLGIP